MLMTIHQAIVFPLAPMGGASSRYQEKVHGVTIVFLFQPWKPTDLLALINIHAHYCTSATAAGKMFFP